MSKINKIVLGPGVNSSSSGSLRRWQHLWLKVYSDRKKQAISDATRIILVKFKTGEYRPLTLQKYSYTPSHKETQNVAPIANCQS